jgi:hypothetical protein
MSIDKYEQETADTVSQAKPKPPPEPCPWCLACGFQHAQDTHCAGCNGDHSAGYCMTEELATELERLGRLRQLVARASNHLYDQALRIVRAAGGE